MKFCFSNIIGMCVGVQFHRTSMLECREMTASLLLAFFLHRNSFELPGVSVINMHSIRSWIDGLQYRHCSITDSLMHCL